MSCGKVRYNGRSEAERKMERVKRSLRLRRKYEPVRAYECPTCGGWHITSTAAPGKPVRVRPLSRSSRTPTADRISADGRWRFVHKERWLAFLDDSTTPYWPDGHLVLGDAVDDAERLVSEHLDQTMGRLRIQQRIGDLVVLRIEGDAVKVKEPDGVAIYRYSDLLAMAQEMGDHAR